MKSRIRFEIDRAKNGEFFVRIVARNGKQTFTSGETYQRKQGAIRAINALVRGVYWSYEVLDLTQAKAKKK